MPDSFYGMHLMLATPFDQEEEVDYKSIPYLVAEAISSGCTGVVGLGVMGEAARLSDKERTKIAETIIDDARNYISKTENKFDAIIYALLDSQTNLSSKGGIRLDSYVYTVEAFK